MYGLKINGTIVPLSKKNSVRIDRYSSLFLDDITTGEFSFPFDLPITPELQTALGNIQIDKAIIYGTEFTCDIIDGGITRYPHGLLKFLGRTDKTIKANITIGASTLSTWLKNTRLRDLDLGTVQLTDEVILKYVTFLFEQPISGDIEVSGTSNFGIGVNGLYNAIPYQATLLATLTAFCNTYNTDGSGTANGNTASVVDSDKIKFTANGEGGAWNLSWSNSINLAIFNDTLGDNGAPTHDHLTVTVFELFDITAYTDEICQEVKTLNGTLTAVTASTQQVAFPIIRNPKFIAEEYQDPAAEFSGYLNYTFVLDDLVPAKNVADDGIFWKYHLSPVIVIKWLLIKIFSLQGYNFSDDFSAPADEEIVTMYSNKSADQIYLTRFGIVNCYAGELLLNTYVPDITVEELVLALKKWSNLYYKADDNSKTIKLNRIDPIFDNINSDVQELSAEEDPTNDFDFVETGLTLSLTHDSDDDLSNELIKSRNGLNQLDDVTEFNTLPVAANAGDIAYVTHQNQYYQLNQEGEWILFSEKLEDDVHDDGSLKVVTTLGTLFTAFEFSELEPGRLWTLPYTKQIGNHLRPTVPNGTTYTPSDKFSLRILYWRGQQNDHGDGDPYYLANNHAALGQDGFIFDHSIHWYGDNGKYETDYRRWYTLIKKTRNNFKTFYLPLHKQIMFDPVKWISANGKRYLCKRISCNVPFSKKVLIECLQSAATEGILFTLQLIACNGDGAFLLEPIIPGGVFSGDGVTFVADGIYFFAPTDAGVGIHEITYTLGQTSATQSIDVKPLPTVTLAPFADVPHTDPPFAFTGGLPLGGVYSIDGFGVQTDFDPGAYGAGVYSINYLYTDGFGCQDFAHQYLTVT